MRVCQHFLFKLFLAVVVDCIAAQFEAIRLIVGVEFGPCFESLEISPTGNVQSVTWPRRKSLQIAGGPSYWQAILREGMGGGGGGGGGGGTLTLKSTKLQWDSVWNSPWKWNKATGDFCCKSGTFSDEEHMTVTIYMSIIQSFRTVKVTITITQMILCENSTDIQ